MAISSGVLGVAGRVRRSVRQVLRNGLGLAFLGLISMSALTQTIGNVANGAALYRSSSCAGCHNSPPDSVDGSRVYNGVDWGRLKAAISNTVNAAYPGLPYRSSVAQDMAKYAATGSKPLSDSQLKDISAYICSTLGSTASTCSAPVAGPPLASIAPTSIAFGSVQVGSPSTAKVVTLSNTGASALLVSAIALTGSGAADFSQTNNCGASVAATSGQCTINLVFNPSSASARSASLVVTHNHNNVAGSTFSVSLSGTGTPVPAPVIAVDKTSLVFGSVLVGQRSAAQVVSLNNIGNAALVVPLAALSITGANAGDFAATHNCPTTLAAGGSCSLSATYAPLSAGLGKTAVLSVANASGLAVTTVSLSGDAANPTPALQLSANSLAFGTQAVGVSGKLSLTLLNVGTGAVVFQSGAFATSGPGFSQTNDCPSSLAVAAQCSVTATFAPVAAGSSTGTLVITSNVTPGTTVTWSGNGVVPTSNSPQIDLAPNGLAFALQVINTRSAVQTITVNNPGSALLTVSGVAVGGASASDYALSSGASACGAVPGGAFSLAPAATCKLYVSYTPGAVGASLAQIAATSDSVGGTASVNLSGMGVAVPAPVVSVDTTLLAYGGAMVVGASSAARTVTLVNSGNANLSASFVVGGASAGDFVVVSGANSCPTTNFTLAPLASCLVFVQYRPNAVGTSSASLVFSTNAVRSPVVALSGIAGAAPAPVANFYGSGAWGSVQINMPSVTRQFTLSNDGNAGLQISQIWLSGSAASDFSTTNDCALTLMPQQTCSVSVIFKPAVVGTRDALLQVQTSASAQALVVSLQGTGSAVAVVAASASAVSTDVVSAAQGAATQAGKSGGCAAGDIEQGAVDPTLLVLSLASLLLWRRRAQTRGRH